MMAYEKLAKWGIFCKMLILFVFAIALAANPEYELKQLLEQIDTSLVTQIQSDFDLWHQYVAKDAHGVLWSLRRESLVQSRDFSYKPLLEKGGIKLDMKHGCAVQEAATLFRAYEITGNRAYLESGLDFCEFLLRAQEITGGYWARTYIVDADGQLTIPGASFTGKVREGETPIVRSSWLSAEEKTCRLQDHYQSRPFYLLLYAYRLSGEQRFFDAAKRVADVVLSIQNINGSWPDEWDFSIGSNEFWSHGTRGVRVGGSFNDDATGDGMRMMIQMYLMTGDQKYIARFGQLGQWLFDTQMGKGKVRGWCQQYDLMNQPTAARSQEMPAIQNLTFTQFVGPMLTWFYALTADSNYAQLVQETYDWIKSVEEPEGWAYQYLADGTPVFSTQFQLYRVDHPESWPAKNEFEEECRWQEQYRYPVSVNLNYIENVLALIKSGGVEAVRKNINGPETVTPEMNLQWRLAAARRAMDPETLQKLKQSLVFPAADGRMPRAEVIWPKLQFIYDVSLARGEIAMTDLLQNSRGYKSTWRDEWKSMLEPWHVMQNWTQIASPVADWLAIPEEMLQRPNTNRTTALIQLTASINRKIFKQAVEDLKVWSRFIEGEQLRGVIPSALVDRKSEAPFVYDDQVKPGGYTVDMRNGCATNEAAILFRMYELLGDQQFLETGLKYCDFLVDAQLEKGHWARTYIINPGEPIKSAQMRHFQEQIPRPKRLFAQPWLIGPESTCRIQDGYQYNAFALLLYAHRLSGKERYLNAAKRVADIVHDLWNGNGSWPDEWDFSLSPCEGPQSTQRGVRLGGSFNDRTTSDGLRMMLQMYLLTGEEKYISRVPALGQWIFDTRLGQDPVIGWCQQYGLDNRPVPARHFEMPVIEPRTFSRFIAPLCGWYYALTGGKRYYDILRKSYFWLRSVEQSDGWAYQYLSDGSPVFSHRFQVYRMDEPETWANDEHLSEILQVKKYKVSRDIVNLKCAEQVLQLIESGGREKLRQAINGRTILEADILSFRMAAARRAIAIQKEPEISTKWSVPDNKKVHWENIMPKLQYVFDVLLADGLISRVYLQQTSRGFQWPHFYEVWHVLGDWTQYATPIENWLAIPVGRH